MNDKKRLNSYEAVSYTHLGTAGVADPCIGYFPSSENAGKQSENGDGHPAGKAYDRGRAHRFYPGNPQPDG